MTEAYTKTYDDLALNWINIEGNPLVYRVSTPDAWDISHQTPENMTATIMNVIEGINIPEGYPEKSRDFFVQAAILFFTT